jgi:hypothetical protein
MPAAAQLEPTSDIDELEQIARQTDIHVNARSGRGNHLFGWSIPPNIERSSVACEKIFVAKESSKPEIPTPVIHIFSGAEVTSYSEALPHIRDRVGAVLKIRYEDFDSLCDFPAGLSGKVFGPAKIKRFGIEKFFDAIRGAGLRIRLEEDPEQTEKMLKRIAENYNPRQANQARLGNSANLSNKFIDSALDYLVNKKGGLARLNKAVKQARANHARRTIAIGVNWAQKRSLQRTGEETLPGSRAHLRVVQSKRRGSKYG